jgi:hypothetical protein
MSDDVQDGNMRIGCSVVRIELRIRMSTLSHPFGLYPLALMLQGFAATGII